MASVADLAALLNAKRDLTRSQAGEAASELLSGKVQDSQGAAFLASLAAKGETDDELLGMLDSMLKYSLRAEIDDPDTAIDVCGTGGDGLGTLNVSTAAAFVVAAAGVPVAKHGNRSSSGGCGSADVLEHFGYDLQVGPESMREMLRDCGICFMFAQKFHPAMKNVTGARRVAACRTAFNILGPLANPARVRRQLVGVSSTDLLRRIPPLLVTRGARRVMAVMSDDGMDELSTASTGRICLADGRDVTEIAVYPQLLGLHTSSIADVQARTVREAATAFVHAIDGINGGAGAETVILNAAAALLLAEVEESLEDAVNVASYTVASGKAYGLFANFVKKYGNPAILEKVT